MQNVYVINDDKTMIYKVRINELIESNTAHEGYISYSLDLVCGKDYISDDYDIEGWCAPDHFVKDAQYDSLLQYFESESLEDVLSENGYRRTDGLPPHIYEWGEEPSEFDMMW